MFCLSFEVETDVFGVTRKTPLKPGGGDIAVTAANRAEYVRLYAQWKLEGAIDAPFEALQRGFLMMCNGRALELLRRGPHYSSDSFVLSSPFSRAVCDAGAIAFGLEELLHAPPLRHPPLPRHTVQCGSVGLSSPQYRRRSARPSQPRVSPLRPPSPSPEPA